MNRVYLDYNATTPVEPQVLDAMLPYFSGDFANASSIHTPGQRARAAVETAREQVAALISSRQPIHEFQRLPSIIQQRLAVVRKRQ